jgi:hypothetical protein
MPVLERLQVTGCTRLSSLQGLPPVPMLTVLSLGWCPQVTSLAGLSDLPALGSVGFSDLAGLAALTGFPPVEADAEIILYRLPALQDLAGMEAVTACANFQVVHCSGVQRLVGLENLKTISFRLNLSGNTSLYDIGALSLTAPVEFVTIGGNSGLDQCRALVHIASWPAVNQLDVGSNGPCAPPSALLAAGALPGPAMPQLSTPPPRHHTSASPPPRTATRSRGRP